MPTEEDITKLNAAGFIVLHVGALATWSLEVEREIGGAGIAIELTPDEQSKAYDQMARIKRAYGIKF